MIAVSKPPPVQAAINDRLSRTKNQSLRQSQKRLSHFSEPALNMNSAAVRSRPATDLREFVSNFDSRKMISENRERRRFGQVNSSVRINDLFERKDSALAISKVRGKFNSLTSSIVVKPRQLTSATSIRTKGTQDQSMTIEMGQSESFQALPTGKSNLSSRLVERLC